MSDSRFEENTGLQDINTIYNTMKDKDKLHEDLWKNILESTEQLDDSETKLTNKEKYAMIISIEFLLVRLRLLVASEQLKVKSIIASPTTPSAWFKPFKDRDVYLATFHQKLLEIREDIAVLQKTMYSMSAYSMQKTN